MISISKFLLFSFAGLASFFILYVYINVMRSFHFYEVPNSRSSHEVPILTGGGWPILLVTLSFFLFFAFNSHHSAVVLCGLALLLGIISWIDDLSPTSAVLRLIIQFIAVACMLSLIPTDQNILFDALPWYADRILVAGGWWLVVVHQPF